MLGSFMLAGSLVMSNSQVSYDDLGYVDMAEPAACTAQFDKGQIEHRVAYDEAAGSMSLVVVVNGEITRPLPLGSRLWITTTWGSAWRALVVETGNGRAKIAVDARFIGDVIADDSAVMKLYSRTTDVGLHDYSMIDVMYDSSDFRQKLAALLQCGHDADI